VFIEFKVEEAMNAQVGAMRCGGGGFDSFGN
jgi:hypothetical protein